MSWKVVGFIAHGFDFFIDIILPATLGSTHPLTEVSNRNICGGEMQCLGLSVFSPLYNSCLKICEPQHPGTLWPCSRPVQELLCLYVVFR